MQKVHLTMIEWLRRLLGIKQNEFSVNALQAHRREWQATQQGESAQVGHRMEIADRFRR
jgi:hypothetical protein